jgi:hypothetical protein
LFSWYIAFAELVAFMEEMNNDDDTALVFKLIDTTEMYMVRVKQLGRTAETRIQSTGLNKRLLSALSDLPTILREETYFYVLRTILDQHSLTVCLP